MAGMAIMLGCGTPPYRQLVMQQHYWLFIYWLFIHTLLPCCCWFDILLCTSKCTFVPPFPQYKLHFPAIADDFGTCAWLSFQQALYIIEETLKPSSRFQLSLVIRPVPVPCYGL